MVSRRRRIFLFAIVLLGFLFQTCLFPYLKLLGAQPDVVLVIVVVAAVLEGSAEGAYLGFFGGMLGDVVSMQPIGVGALVKAAVAFAVGILKENFLTYTVALPMAIVFLSSIVEPALTHGFLILLGGEALPHFQWGTVLLCAVYNMLLVFIVYPILRRFRFEEQGGAYIAPSPR